MTRFTAILILGIIIAAIVYFITNGLPVHVPEKDPSSLLKEAFTSYSAGEKGTTVAERKNDFNAALNIYKQLDKEYSPNYGNGRLYYNIANTYFQLGEYPWAILYYNRALALMPRNEKVQHNLAIALGKLNLPSAPETNKTFRHLFFLHYDLSLPERLQGFFISGLILLLFISMFIWWRKSWIKYVIFLSGIVCLLFLLSVGYTRYLEPVKGVLVKAASLYRDAGTQYAKVIPKPLPAGEKVEVLESREDGHWLKILSPNGEVGYVPMDAIRLI